MVTDTDNGIVQPVVVQDETTPAPATDEAAKQPTLEDVLKQVAEAKAEIARVAEEAKRSVQSAKDKARSEVESAQKRARIAEQTFTAAQKELEESDPGMARDLELARHRAELADNQQDELRRAQENAQASFHQKFVDNLTSSLKELGVDPTDKRIEWGLPDDDYFGAQKRVLASAAKVQKETVATLTKQVKDLQAQLKKAQNGEADSVDTSTGSSSSGSDKDFISKFANGDVPMTKANLARYYKIVG
jgi:hypothetical protein